MSNDFLGFNFLPSSMQPAPDARRGYTTGPVAAADPVTAAPVVGGATLAGDTGHHLASLATTLLHSGV